jgi:hypothetical protein
LITTLYDPANANFIFWWPMYRRGEDILVQNQMLLLMEIEELLDPDNPYSFISEYESSNEDGEKISEWKISVEDISRFLEESGWDL